MNGTQIIGIDLASKDSKDWSSICSTCMDCKSIIESRQFVNEDNKPQSTLFKNCPVCGVKFRVHKIME